MDISEIEVGKRYRFIGDIDSKNILLGIGMRKLYTTDEYVSKHLVFIENSNPDMIGKMFQEGDNADDGIWDRIVAEDSNIYIL
jgi:hypothetical protein